MSPRPKNKPGDRLAVELSRRLRWQEQAACRGMDAELFFSTADADQARALEVCAGARFASDASGSPSPLPSHSASGAA